VRLLQVSDVLPSTQARLFTLDALSWQLQEKGGSSQQHFVCQLQQLLACGVMPYFSTLPTLGVQERVGITPRKDCLQHFVCQLQ
jgi:hypothetical protein